MILKTEATYFLIHTLARAGLPNRAIARRLGVSEEHLSRVLKEGKTPHSAYSELYQAYLSGRMEYLEYQDKILYRDV